MIDIDDVNGRDLDKLVAKHVFGYQVESRTNTRTGEKDLVYNATPEALTPSWLRLPFYSAGIAAAITVEMDLLKHGWTRKTPPLGSPESDRGRVVLAHRDGRHVEAIGSGNEALCRAALKAMGGNDP